MSTPLASEQVKEIRDIFDYQLRNPENTAAATPAADKPQQQPSDKMNPDQLRVMEKEALLTRLASSKQQLDSKMDNYYTRRRLDQEEQQQPQKPQNPNETIDVVPAMDATWMQSSEDSFLRYEQDCDQTVMPSSNNRGLGAPTQDPEMAAIDRLMREYNLDSHADPDQTQLEDVEPPSGIWETTIVSAKMMSPVKMMHALRQSTIIEESVNLTRSPNDSIASSYKTAASSGYSKLAPSERYDTACTETICLSSPDQSQQSTEEEQSNVIEILDDSLETSQRKISSGVEEDEVESKTSSIATLDNSGSVISSVSAFVAPVNNTLDGISSLMPDENSSKGDSGDFSLPESRDSLLDDDDDNSDDTPDFNDTLERIEFMEQQGKKLLEKQKNAAGAVHKPQQPTTPLLAKTLLPLTTSSKRVFYPSPNALNSSGGSSASSGIFKKPGNVRSPQVKFVGPPKRNFDHIVSPIATYIKDVPTSTLYTKYKGQCLFSKNSPIKPNNAQAKDETKENKLSQLKPPQWNIPRKVFTATNNRHVSGTLGYL